MWKIALAVLALVCFVGIAIADRHGHWTWLLGTGLALLTAAFLVKWKDSLKG